MLKAWQLEKTEVTIIRSYSAEVVGTKGKNVLVGFYDDENTWVEAEINKAEFDGHPTKPHDGYYFAIVMFTMKDNPDKQLVGAWPLMMFWHGSWKSEVGPEASPKETV